MKIPKTLGACADRLYVLRDALSDLNKQIDKLKEERHALEEHLISSLSKEDSRGHSGKIANAKVVTKEVPQVKDWPQFYNYLKKSGEFDLMQRRLSNDAVRERWQAGKKIPGVETFTAVTVSVTKV